MNDTHLGAELLELLGELRPRHLEWRDCKVRAVLAPSQKVALGHAVIEEHGRVFGAYGTADMVHIVRVRYRRHSEEAIRRHSRGNQEAIQRQSRGNQEAAMNDTHLPSSTSTAYTPAVLPSSFPKPLAVLYVQ